MAKSKKKPEPVSAHDEAGIARTRLNKQQFLIENMDLLAYPYTGTPEWDKRKIPKNKEFKHITPVTISSSELISILNKTTGAEDFLTASSEEISSLVPSIRLYMPTNKNGKLEDSLVYFGNHIRVGQDAPKPYEPTPGPPTEEQFFQSALGRGVGIKSFSYDQHTNHPGEKSMTAEVELFFQSISDLASGPYIELIVPVLDPDNPSSPMNNPSGKEISSEEKLAAMKKEKKAINTSFSKVGTPPASRIRAVIGWAAPRITPASPLYNKRIAEFVKASQETIILEMTKYDLTFGSEGQATLKISYVARADSAMSGPTADLLVGSPHAPGVMISIKDLTNSWTLGGAKSDFESLDEDSYVRMLFLGELSKNPSVKAIRLQERKARTDIRIHSLAVEIARLEYADDEENEDKITKAEEALEMSKMLAAKIAAFTRAERYGALLKKMNDSQKIYQLTIPDEYLGLDNSGWVTDTVTPERKKFLETEGLKARKKMFGIARSGFSSLSETVTAAAAMTDKTEREEAISSAQKERSSDKEVKMNYMLLGDLLDAAYDLTEQSKNDTRGLILAEFVLPQTMPGINSRRYNIADIPISMSGFEAWFLKKVVKPQRATYPYRTFIKDILKALVEPAMNQPGLLKPRDPAKKSGYSFYFTNLTTPMKFKKGEAYDQASKEIIGIPGTKVMPERYDQSEYNDYLVILSREGYRGTGSYDTDLGRGIYHLIIGGDRGPVKSFSFSQQENKYMHAINMAGASTSNKIGVLALPQDAELNLVGTTLFRQGSLVYIDAEFALGKEVARKLKIGGYYFISKVTHDLSADKYDTKIKCIWQNDYQPPPPKPPSKSQVKSEKAGTK